MGTVLVWRVRDSFKEVMFELRSDVVHGLLGEVGWEWKMGVEGKNLPGRGVDVFKGTVVEGTKKKPGVMEQRE